MNIIKRIGHIIWPAFIMITGFTAMSFTMIALPAVTSYMDNADWLDFTVRQYTPLIYLLMGMFWSLYIAIFGIKKLNKRQDIVEE